MLTASQIIAALVMRLDPASKSVTLTWADLMAFETKWPITMIADDASSLTLVIAPDALTTNAKLALDDTATRVDRETGTCRECQGGLTCMHCHPEDRPTQTLRIAALEAALRTAIAALEAALRTPIKGSAHDLSTLKG